MRRVHCAVLMTVVWIAGCHCSPESHSYSPAENRDHLVLRAALKNILDDPKNLDIRVPYCFTLEPFRAEHESWQKPEKLLDSVPELRRSAAHEALEAMEKRVNESVTFVGFKPNDPRIVFQSIEESKAMKKADPFGHHPYPAQSWLPGYSADGQCAVIRIMTPWSMHSAGVYSFLVVENGEWTVFARNISVYP